MPKRLVAAPGTVLAGRYRLDRPVAHRPATTLWRGIDDVLARPVAVKIVDDPAALDGGPDAFLAAAVAAGRFTHPRVTSTYDAATEDGLVYVVTEWVDGRALADVLRDGPLAATRATTLVAQVAETLVHAHERGVHHLDLDAHNVLVTADGNVKVTDFQLGATCRPAAGASRPFTHLEPAERDTRAAGALLYACLTGRSAYGAEPELPLAPARDGRLLAPRQVRAGVPRDVDAVVVRTLLPEVLRNSRPIATARDLLGALAVLPGDGAPAPADVEPAEAPPPRRLFRLGIPLLVVACVGVAGLLAGLAVGRVPGTTQKYPGLGPPASPGATPTSGVALRPVAVRDFDPLGDGRENRNQVPLATDTELQTAWTTTVYYNNPRFGGLKSGVGLLVDLGTPATVARVQVAFARPGVSLEVRAADTLGADAAAFPVVRTVDDARREENLTLDRPVRARYWLLWFTELVESDAGKYSAGISEFAFYP